MRVLIPRFLRVGLQTAHPCQTLFILSALALATAAHAAPLNDTGIDFCGDDTTNTADCAAVSADGGSHSGEEMPAT